MTVKSNLAKALYAMMPQKARIAAASKGMNDHEDCMSYIYRAVFESNGSKTELYTPVSHTCFGWIDVANGIGWADEKGYQLLLAELETLPPETENAPALDYLQEN